MLYKQIDTANRWQSPLRVPMTFHTDKILLSISSWTRIRGEWIVLMKVPPGVQLPSTTPVRSWSTRSRQVEIRGTRLSPGLAASCTKPLHRRTFEVVAEGESGYVTTLVQVNGDLLFLDDKGNIIALENWKTSLNRYLAYCEQHGIEPRDLTAFN
jgi:hypothetical protein